MENKTINFLKKYPLYQENQEMKKKGDYIISFKKRELSYFRDEYKKIIIKKYYNDTEPIIL